jgi:hypothetical protein
MTRADPGKQPPAVAAMFDGVAERYDVAKRSWPVPGRAYAVRVDLVRPGGRLVVCECSHPTNPAFRALYLAHLLRAIPTVTR